jgi:hypothetical protein
LKITAHGNPDNNLELPCILFRDVKIVLKYAVIMYTEFLLAKVSSSYHSKKINISHFLYSTLPLMLTKYPFSWSHNPPHTHPWPHPHDGVNWWFLVMEQNTRARREFAVLKEHTSFTAHPTHSMIM